MIGLVVAITLATASHPHQDADRLQGPAHCVAALQFFGRPADADWIDEWTFVMTSVEPDVSLHQPAIDRAAVLIEDVRSELGELGMVSINQGAEQCRALGPQLRSRRLQGSSGAGVSND